MARGDDFLRTVRPWIQRHLKNIYFVVKMINFLQFCTATPSLEIPNGCRRSWGWGVRECWEGECRIFRPLIGTLPDHSSLALLKTLISPLPLNRPL